MTFLKAGDEGSGIDNLSTSSFLAPFLRDFFIASNPQDLEKAFAGLAGVCPQPAPDSTDWQEAEYAFNRLFVGPAALEAPPFASVYLDPEGRVMGTTTLAVRDIYAALGLESPWKNILPDDHLSLELDAAIALEHAVRQTVDATLHELHAHFLNHLTAWVPPFIERIRTAPSGHPAITYAADCLSAWLNGLRQDVRHTTEESI